MHRLRPGLALLCVLMSAASGRHLRWSDQLRHQEEHNAATTADGLTLFESDILLPEAGADRTSILLAKLWPLGEPVPYAITPEVELRRTNIEAAIAHWENTTCVTFTEKPVDYSGGPHLRFINGNGCYSFLGRLKKPAGQVVSIGNGCGGLTTTSHEIGHSLGFFHEQSRTDRDEHVEVMWDNIKQKSKSNFNMKVKGDLLGISYDLRSIMHYAAFAFSIDRTKPTLRARDPLEQHLVGKRIGRMTHRDMAGANLAYRCADHCSSPPVCLNEGYVDKFCTCVCPDGITGELCETKPADYRYYGPLCGDVNITSPSTITTDQPTSNSDEHCFWLVTAPQGQEVSLTFGDVSMNLYPNCGRDSLRVAIEGDLRDPATVECGETLSGTQHQSVGGRLLLHFRLRGSSRRPRKFTAEVAFVPAA